MAIGKASDFVLYEEQFWSGVWEGLDQVAVGFNDASNGTIRLVPRDLVGRYEQEAFFKSISNLITRRDVTAVTAATDLAMTQGEFVSVKINRKIGPVAQTLDAWRKIGTDWGEMSFILGQKVAQEQAKDLLNTALICGEAALEGQSSLVYDATGLSTKTATHAHFNAALAKLGDFSGRVACWVMHSKVYHDLLGQAITDNVFQIGGLVIQRGQVPIFGRPVVVIDAPALTDANGSLTDTFNTLGLVPDAIVITESESREIIGMPVSGLENLVYRVQGEYAFNAAVKGFQWDITNGAANPTDAALGTTTNWDLAVTSYKNAAGVRLVTQ